MAWIAEQAADSVVVMCWNWSPKSHLPLSRLPVASYSYYKQSVLQRHSAVLLLPADILPYSTTKISGWLESPKPCNNCADQ